MNFFQALFLGLIQGFTEFLPISSSAHLIVFPRILGWGEQPLVFDTTVHLGTALALIAYFKKDIYQIITKERSLGIKILLGSIPAGLLGLVFDRYIENNFRTIFYVIVFMSLGSLLMLIAERFFRAPLKGKISLKKSIVIGFYQALALLPGVSRSGATISGGMLNGLRHQEAARFSFLLSIPIVVLAGLYKLYGTYASGVVLHSSLIVGFFSSFLFGLAAIRFLMGFLKKNRLYIFIMYRVVLVLVLLHFIS